MNNKLKLATIIGTRPEVIRLSQIIKKCDVFFEHILIHTGQNYDYELNKVFFEDLELREPDYYLNVAGENLGDTIGNIISKSYNLLNNVKPDALLILGDTNSALSVISAKRLKIPVFHMEAGNRCFDQNVPEELNRKVADHLSDINLCYSENSRRYLLSEGFRKDHVLVSGSPLKEVLLYNEIGFKSSNILSQYGLEKDNYFIVSLHREENIENRSILEQIFQGIENVGKYFDLPILFSTHPRTKKKLEQFDLRLSKRIQFCKAFGFFDYINLQTNAKCVLSDSGSISEEASMLGFRAISLRNSTERPEAMDAGSIILGNTNPIDILRSTIIQSNLPVREQHFNSKGYQIEDVSSMVVRMIASYTPIVNKEIWKKEF